jgi:1-deoxy-D-xylulose-5-phosphate reductoisomerase
MVSYVDGSVLAQLGNPDMRTPIAHALAFPERIESGVAQLDLTTMAALQFHAPDLRRFPCLALAFDALRAGGTAPALLNAANEVAVQAFLDRRIGFRDIDRVVRRVMDEEAARRGLQHRGRAGPGRAGARGRERIVAGCAEES